jgi:Rod binding domain-containing protein
MLSIAATTATAGTGQISSSSPTPSPKLVNAAHEFEAQMMEELLKPMMAGDGLDGEDDDSASGSSGALGQFATEALGRAMSDRGGFGIATSIIKELTPKGNKKAIAPVTGNLRGNTVIHSHE